MSALVRVQVAFTYVFAVIALDVSTVTLVRLVFLDSKDTLVSTYAPVVILAVAAPALLVLSLLVFTRALWRGRRDALERLDREFRAIHDRVAKGRAPKHDGHVDEYSLTRVAEQYARVMSMRTCLLDLRFLARFVAMVYGPLASLLPGALSGQLTGAGRVGALVQSVNRLLGLG